MDTVQGISQKSSGGGGQLLQQKVHVHPQELVSVRLACVCVTHVTSVSLAEVSSSKACTVMPTLNRPFSSKTWCGRHNLSWRERGQAKCHVRYKRHGHGKQNFCIIYSLLNWMLSLLNTVNETNRDSPRLAVMPNIISDMQTISKILLTPEI